MHPTPATFCRLIFAMLILALGTQVIAQTPSEFGTPEVKNAAMIGILYDLKQDQKQQPMRMSHKAYGALIDEFISKNWDEDVLNRYFRASRPLYTTQIFIPVINANTAPKAFGVDNIVKPMYWVIHYKGQVSAPTSGT